MSKLDDGSIELPLRGGDPVTLQPTIAAALEISRRFDGFQGALRAIAAMNLEAVGFIVAAGAGARPKDREAYVGRVFATGVMNVLGLVTRYVVILSNGGLPVSDGEAAGDGTTGE